MHIIYAYCQTCILVQGVSCGSDCRCHYNISQRVNIFTCSGTKYTELPGAIPDFTNWMDIEHHGITRLCGKYDYLKRPSNITHLDLYSGQTDFICDDILNEIFYCSEVKLLNLAKNKLRIIPTKFNETGWKLSDNIKKILLGGNPVQCDCDMLWLISWLNNTRVSGQRLVQDYQDVICTGGQWDGIPVYRLDKVKMGCYPKKVVTWIIVVSSVIGGLMLITVILVIIVYRQRTLVRWWMYKRFDKLIGNPDKMEDLTDMEYDAFLSYRFVSALNILVVHSAKRIVENMCRIHLKRHSQKIPP